MVKKLTIYNALEPFLATPNEKLHLAEISREINAPHPTVRQWLNIFEKKGVLKKEHKGRLTFYSLNLQNQNIIDHLVIAEKNKLIRKSEEDILLAELVSFLTANLEENTKSLIFGSAAESFRKANDVDLLIIGKTDTGKINKFSDKVNKEIHTINLKNLKQVSESLRKEIIKKHLLVKGSEDFMRWILWQQ